MVAKTKIFKTSQTDLIKYNGMECEVISKLNEVEYDKHLVGMMYNIRLLNGIKLQAFKGELF